MENFIKEQTEMAQELIACGNSKEKAEGYGMMNVINAISNKKVYVINCNELVESKHHSEISDEEFIEEAEKQYRVFTIDEFIKEWNNEEYLSSFNDYIRII
jgi:hypothetical protein